NEDWANDKARSEKWWTKEGTNGAASSINENPIPATPHWYVNGQGQTMVVIPGPVEFMIGSPSSEKDRRPVETQHRMRIGRTFVLAAKPVTMEQFRCFEKNYSVGEAKYHRTADMPAVGIDWFRAARYCNWLSKQESIPEEEWCYEITDDEIKLKRKYL